MSNVKPGDLAIIKGSLRNDGLIVEVLSLYSFMNLRWLVKSVGGKVRWYSMKKDGSPAGSFEGTTAFISHNYLRPLPGDTETEETEDKMIA